MSIRGLSPNHRWDYENGFYWFSHPTRINKLLAHYEIYKSITDLPGDVLELGVYKGASLIRLATFRNALENDFSRKIVGFDAFGRFPRRGVANASDSAFISRFEKEGGHGLGVDTVEQLMTLKGFENVHLVKGNVMDTLPAHLDQNPQTRIAFLHLDMDLREPTAFALELLYDRVVANGVVVFDDYGSVAGESDAVDEFVRDRKLELQKLTYYSVPSFVRKPA
jgi:hypothetical protein